MIYRIATRISLVIAAALALASAPAFAANPQVELDTTLGKIRIELYPDAAPKTVENFLKYVKDKFYDGTQFHRVIDGFMIQGGGFTTEFYQKPTRAPVVNEAEMSSKAGIKNVPGTIAMARTADPNSATSQFFINVANNVPLNFRSPDPGGIGYTAFGKVIDGMDVVNKIAKVTKGGAKVPPGTPMSPADVPSTPVLITSAYIVEPAK
ncbi:MAG TPA: peptidylprolyl isomerase [Casimicrobiaceae bacterium]|nr:peptidylprolyl isomerase [Casimicrobiaceae bacterium]